MPIWSPLQKYQTRFHDFGRLLAASCGRASAGVLADPQTNSWSRCSLEIRTLRSGSHSFCFVALEYIRGGV